MAVLVLTVILCCVVFAWLRLRPRHRSPHVVPGALPFIGHGLQLIGDRKYLKKFLEDSQKYSLSKGVIEFWLGNHSFYVVTDPEDSQRVANTCLNKPYPYSFAKDFVGNGLLTTEASKWKIHRKLLNPAFSQHVLNTYIYEMSVQARNLASQLSSKAGKGPFDARKCFINFALSTVTRTSLRLNAHDKIAIDTDYAEGVENLLTLYCVRFQKVWLHWSYIFDWSTMKRKQNQIINNLKNIINPIIYKRRSELKANKDTIVYDDSPGKFKPILDQMLQMAEEQDVFTDDDIRHHLDTFVAAAYDTTSRSMVFILLAIGSDPELQERLFKELQEVLLHEDDDLTKEDLHKLVLLEAVIKETLRLHPVIPFIGRQLDTDLKLSNCTLRAGNTCGIGLYGLLRHPMWGPDAEQFRPERWLDPANLPDHPSFHAAFGVGKRNCIGKQYSMMLLKAALTHILRRYHVTGNIRNLVCEYDVMLKPVEGHFIGLTLRT